VNLSFHHHQNIRGVQSKTIEISCYICSDLPHVTFFSVHHLYQSILDLIHIENFALKAKYCRKNQKGGVSIFIQNNLQFTTINRNSYSIDKDIEVCALQLNSSLLNICVLVIYRSWIGKFKSF